MLAQLRSRVLSAHGHCKLQVGKRANTRHTTWQPCVPSVLPAASSMTLRRLQAKIVASPFLETWTLVLETKGHFRKSPSKSVARLDLEPVFPTPSLHWPQMPGVGGWGSSETTGRSSPSEQACSPLIPCTGQAQVRNAVSASHTFRRPSLQTSGRSAWKPVAAAV